ncbi:MAG: DUF1667 domain-containing protein [Oscillospiraceae bacterium]
MQQLNIKQKVVVTCIICPNSCKITIEEKNGEQIYSGNQCKRGINFAQNEITNPKRSFQTTVKTASKTLPYLPVKTNGEIPKSELFHLIKELNKITVTQNIRCGDIVLADFCGVSIVSCTDMTLEY